MKYNVASGRRVSVLMVTAGVLCTLSACKSLQEKSLLSARQQRSANQSSSQIATTSLSDHDADPRSAITRSTAVQQTAGVGKSSKSGSKSRVIPAAYEPPSLPADGATVTNWGDCREATDAVAGNYPPGWQPDGLVGPWPYDEYLFDGGDGEPHVQVRRDWTVNGLEMEDTVVHYDTRSGKTLVQPSNRVPIYAPRFASVRKIYGLEEQQIRESVAAIDRPQRLNSQDYRVAANTTVQPVQPGLQHGFRAPVNLRDRVRGIVIDNTKILNGVENTLLPYEDLAIIRRGQYQTAEQAKLAERSQAAITWASDQAVQVVVDGQLAHEAKGLSAAQETSVYELQDSTRVRIVKIASKSEALPGEEIDFTIRVDNIGEYRVGNVTVIDSLTTRLEYIPDSTSCTLDCKFYTQQNEGESLVLRWEITDPLEVGQGAIIRFKCRLR